MKEKISRNKISRHYKSFFGLENMGLGENDNLMIDWGESLVNDFCNQEAEKRIAEKMPSKAEKEAAEIMQHLKAYGMIHPVTAVKYPEGTHEDFIKRADEWIWRFRSRLTCSEKPNNSQKTEGGGG